MSNLNEWFFGIDAGASQTRLYAHTKDRSSDFRLFGGPANAFRDGKNHAAFMVSRLINEGYGQIPPGTLCGIHAGIAGIGSLKGLQGILDQLYSLTDAGKTCKISVSNDGLIALQGALSGGSGLVFIAGTGSGVLAKTGPSLSDMVHVGGWGYSIGDEGSGYSIGRRTMAAIAHQMDGGPSTILSDMAKHHLGVRDRYSLLNNISQPDWRFQDIVPHTLNAAEQGDEIATSIVENETKLLANQLTWILNKYPNLNPVFTAIGGLCNHQYYLRNLSDAVTQIWPEASYIAPQYTPAEGAAQIAVKRFNNSDGFESENLLPKGQQA